jgi:hypothetical protein
MKQNNNSDSKELSQLASLVTDARTNLSETKHKQSSALDEIENGLKQVVGDVEENINFNNQYFNSVMNKVIGFNNESNSQVKTIKALEMEMEGISFYFIYIVYLFLIFINMYSKNKNKK